MVFDKKKNRENCFKDQLTGRIEKIGPIAIAWRRSTPVQVTGLVVVTYYSKKKVNCGKTHFYNNNNNKNPS